MMFQNLKLNKSGIYKLIYDKETKINDTIQYYFDQKVDTLNFLDLQILIIISLLINKIKFNIQINQ